MEYEPEPHRPTFPLDFPGQRYEYQKQKYQKQLSANSAAGRTPAGADNINSFLTSDPYISGQTIESIVAMISLRHGLKRRIH
jgi:hypothetical protein